MNDQIIDPIIKKYVDLVKANTDAFKTFYQGDPILIPVSSMPALVISRKTTQVNYFTNTEDQHFITLVFTIVADIRKDISDDRTLVAGNATLYDLMEGRDPVTYQLKSQSLMYILRHNQNIDMAHQIITDLSSLTRIDYGMVLGKRVKDSWSIEGTINAVVSLVQSR